jgi:hypothetical protein
MSDWNPYPKSRKSKECEGFLLIVPEDYDENTRSMPIFCDVCQFAFSRPDDRPAFKRFGCCSICADTWAYSHQKEWSNGWRPSAEQIAVVVERRNVVEQTVKFE